MNFILLMLTSIFWLGLATLLGSSLLFVFSKTTYGKNKLLDIFDLQNCDSQDIYDDILE